MNGYRTDEQFETICENMVNGNWSDAAQNCVDFGFYANDLSNKQEEYEDAGMNPITDRMDFATLCEMATELRHK